MFKGFKEFILRGNVIDLAVAPDLAFDAANLECLCPPCHSRETRHRQNASGNDAHAERTEARTPGP